MQKAIQKAIEGGWKRKMIGVVPTTVPWNNEMRERWRAASEKKSTIREELSYSAGYGEGNRDACILLDPLFWQCLGKAMGWNESKSCYHYPQGAYRHTICLQGMNKRTYHWHCFIDKLASGWTAESFFNELLK